MRDRNAKYKPWSRLIPFQVPPEAAVNRVVAAFQNHIVTVFVKEVVSPYFKDPDGNSQVMVHLMLQWAKGLRGTDDYFYRMKQHVKSELCGPQSEYVELGPGAWREEDYRQTFLWVLPQGATYPLGLVPNDIEGKMSEISGGRENVVMKEDLEVFVVKHLGNEDEDSVIEVFVSEDECNGFYGDRPLPEGCQSGIEMIGDVPSESTNVAWTDAAKAKVANVMAKSQRVQSDHHETPELFYDKATIEDEIFPDLDDSNSSIEENLAIATIMRQMSNYRDDERVKRLRSVTEEVIGRSLDGIDLENKSDDKPRIIYP
jgi:hypothetical protein